MKTIDLYPKKCNICGGKVIYTTNARIYGKEYGSGKMYYCTKCHAHVGTHKPRPKEALGLLADAEMRKLKEECHELFDKKWKDKSTSKQRHNARYWAYVDLANKMGISVEECHFGWFDKEELLKALSILRSEE